MIRSFAPADAASVTALLEAAFAGPAEAALVAALRDDLHVVAEYVATDADRVVGHVLFSRMDPPDLVALAPLAVAESHRRRGIGAALVRAGLEACRTAGIGAVTVLGDPAYYGRFGFSAAIGARIATPYAGPYFQALELRQDALAAPLTATYPAPFAALG